jgi:hypothetical protein
MCYIDGQKNKYSVLNECNRMLKYNIKVQRNREMEEWGEGTVLTCKNGGGEE